MTTARYVNAFHHGRGGKSSPLLHASPSPPEPTGPTAGWYRAACGKLVRNITRVAWNPYGAGRRCRACVLAVRR